MDVLEKRNEEVSANFERQIRELRTQISMKNKDIANFREEQSDLETRLTNKVNEVRSIKTQMQ